MKLDNDTINVTKNGTLAHITKPILRELAQEFRIPLYNQNGTEHNTRHLGVLIIRAIETLSIRPISDAMAIEHPINTYGIDTLLDSYKNKYRHGSFYLQRGENIGQVLTLNYVPNSYGVYIIYSVTSREENIIYIGKSGTLQNNGTFKRQGIAGRLKAVSSNNISRNVYFQDVMKENDFDKLKFCWIVTVNDNDIEIPALVESKLLQAYFDENTILPQLNKSI